MKTLLLLLTLTAQAAPHEPTLPDASTRSRMVLDLAQKMAEVDGEALFVRRNRPLTFWQIADRLSRQAAAAKDWPSLFRVFARLDNAYPNLHASFTPGPWAVKSEKKFKPKAQINSDWLAPTKIEYRISGVDEDFSGAQKGDRVLAVNGKSMKRAASEYFEFCKMPLREQCDEEFSRFMELDGKPLRYTLERNGKIWRVDVPVSEVPRRAREEKSCDEEKNLYEGFRLAYAGHHACFYENEKDTGVVLLRIRSFLYEDSVRDPVTKEVDAFWPWWKNQAPATRHLLIDLANNGGGNAPVPYYEVIFPRPFQEQWVTYRKLPLMLDPVLRSGLFWGDQNQERWFQLIQEEGIWARTLEGDFLPPVPMFCSSSDPDCRKSRYSVRDHGFRGKVSLIVNPGCVSSCDGFTYAFREELNARVVGQPQAADSAYSRLRIDVLPDAEKGIRLELNPHTKGVAPEAYLSQKVVISRSVTENGTVVSGIPVPVDLFVPRYHDQTPEEWRRSAVNAALQQPGQ